MPLECSHCKKRFKVTFRNREEAIEFQEILNDHMSKFHPGKDTLFRHVDEKGVEVDDNSSIQALEEEEKLKKVSQWVN